MHKAPMASFKATNRVRDRWVEWAGLAFILLVAAALRLWRLDAHGLWWDEGNNAYLAHLPLKGVVEMSRLTTDTNPPAHRLALGLWLRLWGDSVFAARLLSVVCGLGVIGLTYLWGKRLGGRNTGLLAAALLALAPMAIFYDREAKGYAFVSLWGWLALTLFAQAHLSLHKRLSKRRAFALWTGYALATALMLGAHYYGALFILAQGIWLSLYLAIHRPGWKVVRQHVFPWIAALAGAGALLAPWVALTWQTALAGAQNVPMNRSAWDAATFFRYVATTLAAGPYGRSPWNWIALGALGIPAMWGALSQRDAWRGLIATLLVVPPLAGLAVQSFIPFVIPRFFLYLLPALCLLASSGLARLGKGAIPFALALVIAWGFSLPHAYRPFVRPEDDLSPLGQTFAQLARPGDAVITTYIWQEGMLRLYAPRAPVTYYLGWFTDEDVTPRLEALFSEHPRVWLVTYQLPLQHPANQAGWWLEHHAARAIMQEHGHNRLVLYVRPCQTLGLKPMAIFNTGLRLYAGPIPSRAAPGDVLSIALQWEATRPNPPRHSVFVQLLGPDGRLVTQADGEPCNGLVPLNVLTPGGPLTDCRALVIPPEAPPGHYRLIAGLYDPQTLQRVPIDVPNSGADHALLGQVFVQPPE